MAEKQEKFGPGAKVLAYHGPLVYEAKVLKYHEKGKLFVEIGDGKSEPIEMNKIPGFLFDVNAYFLHYKGWNLKWDEWVSSERIMEFNDDNLGLSRELRNARKKPIERLDSGKEANAEAAEQRGRRGKRKDSNNSQKLSNGGEHPIKEHTKSNGIVKTRHRSEHKPAYEVILPFRPRLKCILVDDWELITKDRKLVDLDTTTPVAEILQTYQASNCKGQDEAATRVTQEALDGLRVYFNESLSMDLLYRFERLQYSDSLQGNPNFDPSLSYGLEHLLRLLISLPARVAQVSMDAISVNVLMGQMKDLLDFLDDNLERFSSSYMNASPQYDRLARG